MSMKWWLWYDVVGVQHAKGASWEEERDDNRDDKMKHESGRRVDNGKENLRAPSASPVRTWTDLPRRGQGGMKACLETAFYHNINCIFS
jgi:hypothetical protein